MQSNVSIKLVYKNRAIPSDTDSWGGTGRHLQHITRKNSESSQQSSWQVSKSDNITNRSVRITLSEFQLHFLGSSSFQRVGTKFSSVVITFMNVFSTSTVIKVKIKKNNTQTSHFHTFSCLQRFFFFLEWEQLSFRALLASELI
jgi:hypothetical protein